MTIAIVFLIGIIVTVLLGYAAYRNMSGGRRGAQPNPQGQANQPRGWYAIPSWGRQIIVGGVVIILVLAILYAVGSWLFGGGDNKEAEVAESIAPDLAGEGEATLILKEGEPRKISIPPAHRWDIVPPYPSGWATNNGERDDNYNRIQIFKVVPPEKEVQLKVRIRKCLSAKDCTW